MSFGDLSLAGPRNQAAVKLLNALGQSLRPRGFTMSAAQPPSVPTTRRQGQSHLFTPHPPLLSPLPLLSQMKLFQSIPC